MKKIFFPAALLLSCFLTGAELVYKNAFFQVRFDTKGAVIKELIHKKENWNGSAAPGNSFGETFWKTCVYLGRKCNFGKSIGGHVN